MGGATVSSNPTVIAGHERDRAGYVLEKRIPRLVAAVRHDRGPEFTGQDVRHVMTALRVLLRHDESRPIVLAALCLDQDASTHPLLDWRPASAREPVGYQQADTCATCDGGGCRDCVDP